MKHLISQILKNTIINNISSTRFYYSKPTLHSKIRLLGDPKIKVSPVLDHWVQCRSKKASFAELKRIIIHLRQHKRFSQALQVSEWMQMQGLYTITAIEHAVQLDLIGKVHGLVSAETYFNNLDDHERVDKTYGALLHCYVQQNQIEKALTHMEKMVESGLASSPVSFNDVMSLYTNNNRFEEVLHVFTQMKEHGISPNNLSYRLCINAYGQRSEIEGMQKILEEMESRPDFLVDSYTYTVVANLYIKAGLNHEARNVLMKVEERLDGKDKKGYNHLISLHAKLGNKTDVFRIWELEKSACKRCVNSDYVVIIKSLVNLGELEEAEKMLVDWESSEKLHDVRVPIIVILGYIAKRLYGKAEMILEEFTDKGIEMKPDSWAKLAEGYLDSGGVENAVKCMKVALPVSNSEGYNPHHKLVTRTLVSVLKVGIFEDLQILIDSLRNVTPLDRQS